MISAAPPSNIDFNEEVRPLTLNIGNLICSCPYIKIFPNLHKKIYNEKHYLFRVPKNMRCA